MSISEFEPLARKVSFDSDNMWIELVDGRQLGVPLAYFPRLADAKPSDRRKYIISGGGVGIHWDSLNEDISVSALLQGRVDQTSKTSRRSKDVA